MSRVVPTRGNTKICVCGVLVIVARYRNGAPVVLDPDLFQRRAVVANLGRDSDLIQRCGFGWGFGAVHCCCLHRGRPVDVATMTRGLRKLRPGPPSRRRPFFAGDGAGEGPAGGAGGAPP